MPTCRVLKSAPILALLCSGCAFPAARLATTEATLPGCYLVSTREGNAADTTAAPTSDSLPAKFELRLTSLPIPDAGNPAHLPAYQSIWFGWEGIGSGSWRVSGDTLLIGFYEYGWEAAIRLRLTSPPYRGRGTVNTHMGFHQDTDASAIRTPCPP